MDEGFSAELNEWLHEAEGVTEGDGATPSERYEVRRTLKSAPDELTQVVYRRAFRGTEPIGPFVRKVFADAIQGGVPRSGRGVAYARIMAAQAHGSRFAHQPIVYDLSSRGDDLDVILEYVHGSTLRDVAMREGTGIDLLRRIAPSLCEAVDELHSLPDGPLIHRDIKPSNIMLTTDDRLMLIDLGIARAWHEGASRDTERYGTPGYAPPEQFGYGQTSIRSDIYALGMTLAFCLLGEDPTGTLREAEFADPRIPLELRPVLAKATAFDPSARHASARELAEDLSTVLGGSRQTASAPPPAATSVGFDKLPPVSSVRFGRLGMIWNYLLAGAWLLIVVASIAVALKPDGGVFAAYPLWFRTLIYLGMAIVPTGCVAYLALDKRRLREHRLFAGRTWLQEFLFCIALVFVCVLVCLLLYYLFVERR
ncbi:MAG: serine/threonine protein kinase [Atopobiaceae bacterium]|nr:serine/threonine protein kinase [Atopobiaceae bacterium]